MPATTSYKPRLFGKTGLDALNHVAGVTLNTPIDDSYMPPSAAQSPLETYGPPAPTAQPPANAVAPTPPAPAPAAVNSVDMGNPMMAPDTGQQIPVAAMTPIQLQNYYRDQAAQVASRPIPIHNVIPQDVLGQHQPTYDFNQLPPQQRDIGPDVDKLLKWYPLVAALGGYQAANTILPSAVQGLDVSAQSDYARGIDAWQRQKELADAQYGSRIKSYQETQDAIRYQNQANDQNDQNALGRQKQDASEANNLYQQAVKATTEGRKNLLGHLRMLYRSLGGGNFSGGVEEAKRTLEMIDQDERALKTQYGYTSTDEELQPLPSDAQYFERARQIYSQWNKASDAKERTQIAANANIAGHIIAGNYSLERQRLENNGLDARTAKQVAATNRATDIRLKIAGIEDRTRRYGIDMVHDAAMKRLNFDKAKYARDANYKAGADRVKDLMAVYDGQVKNRNAYLTAAKDAYAKFQEVIQKAKDPRSGDLNLSPQDETDLQYLEGKITENTINADGLENDLVGAKARLEDELSRFTAAQKQSSTSTTSTTTKASGAKAGTPLSPKETKPKPAAPTTGGSGLLTGIPGH